jgi:hypothetical protein
MLTWTGTGWQTSLSNRPALPVSRRRFFKRKMALNSCKYDNERSEDECSRLGANHYLWHCLLWNINRVTDRSERLVPRLQSLSLDICEVPCPGWK